MATPVYLTPPELWVLFGVGLLLGSRELIVRQYLGLDDRPAADGAGSFWVLWAATAAGTTVAVVAPLAGVGRLPAATASFWVGVAVMLVGFAVRMTAVVTLGEQFSHRVVVADREVIDTGPYAWVRHPSYTGAVVTYFGVGVACGDWVSVLAATGGAIVGYGHRVRLEEHTLSRELDDYAAYARRVPYRLIPFVW